MKRSLILAAIFLATAAAAQQVEESEEGWVMKTQRSCISTPRGELECTVGNDFVGMSANFTVTSKADAETMFEYHEYHMTSCGPAKGKVLHAESSTLPAKGAVRRRFLDPGGAIHCREVYIVDCRQKVNGQWQAKSCGDLFSVVMRTYVGNHR